MIDIDKIYCMDCIDGMKLLDDNSIDACITDPPYELGFMGKKWDKNGISNNIEMWKEVYRILKPGAHLLSFGGSRTYHRMACAIEDAGFEIRDQIMWVYGSGFPKSLNVGKAIDKLQGNEREVVGKYQHPDGSGDRQAKGKPTVNTATPRKQDGEWNYDLTKGTSEWEGWGTALKPAHEPIVLASKPLSEKTVAENVLRWGVGGLNIDGCRIGNDTILSRGGRKDVVTGDTRTGAALGMNGPHEPLNTLHQGRFPANFIHDGSDEVLELFPNAKSTKLKGIGGFGTNNCTEGGRGTIDYERGFNDNGSASRFFYCAKASKKERDMGLEKTSVKKGELINRIEGSAGASWNDNYDTGNAFAGAGAPKHNNHPTVKPIALMEYLVKLVTKENQIVIDPFLGSGSTLIACRKLNRNFIGFEKEQEYVDIANKRLESIPIKLEVFE